MPDYDVTWPILLTDAVNRAKTLKDMGIYPITRWKLTGRCSMHGHQVLYVETTEELTAEILSGYIKCNECGIRGVDRWLPVAEFNVVKREEK